MLPDLARPTCTYTSRNITKEGGYHQEPVVREAGYAGTVCAVLDQLNSSTDAFFGAIVSTSKLQPMTEFLGPAVEKYHGKSCPHIHTDCC